VLSIIVLFVYYAMVALFGAFGKNGALDPYVAAWLPNVIATIVGSYLVWREDR
jgi:lipopolysaccharide export system permease protein